MSNRLLRAILMLYPRGFRQRYGPEMQDLVNDLEAAGDRSRLRLVGGLLLSAGAERLRAVRLDARLAIHALAAVAALSTIVGLSSSPAGRHFPRHVAHARTYPLAPTTSTPPVRVKFDATGGAALGVPGGGPTSVSAPRFALSTSPGTASTSTTTAGTGTSATPSVAGSAAPAAQGTSSAPGPAEGTAETPTAVSTAVPLQSMPSATGSAETSVTPGQ
jgi:hypothetical protein